MLFCWANHPVYLFFYSIITLIMTISSSIIRVSIGLLSMGVATLGLIESASADAGNIFLRRGSSFNSFAYSPNRCFVLRNQGGNYIVQNRDTEDILWQSNTRGRSTMMRFQPDGNLVVYDESRTQGGKRKPLWASGTDKKSGTIVQLQNDGNLVMQDKSKRPMWSSDKFDASYWNQKCR